MGTVEDDILTVGQCATALADMEFHIAGAWRHDQHWTLRIESNMEADHATYYSAGGLSFDEAMHNALDWARSIK